MVAMKFYTTKFAPNPRRVEIYLNEKEITDIERVMVNLLKDEHRAPELKKKNPLGLLPVLELDDGRVVTDELANVHRWLAALAVQRGHETEIGDGRRH